MSITIIREGDRVRIIDGDGEVPAGIPVRLFTVRELEGCNAGRENIPPRAGPASYKEWMEEDVWDAAGPLPESPGSDLRLEDFIP